jgi:hypothetical protein
MGFCCCIGNNPIFQPHSLQLSSSEAASQRLVVIIAKLQPTAGAYPYLGSAE